MNGMIDPNDLEILAGSDSVTYWRPEDGLPKAFCSICGGHVWSGEPGVGDVVGVRFGALHGDPGIDAAVAPVAVVRAGLGADPRRRPAALLGNAARSLNLIGYSQLLCTSNWRGTSAGRSSGSASSRCAGC